MILLILITFWLSTSYSDSAAGKGIVFFEGTLKEAFELSRKTNKPIFVDVYASWCGQCRQLKKTFKDAEVAAYYNANFINIAVDGEKDDGPALMKRYGIKSYPTLLILDANSKQLARATGFMKPYILINFGRRVVP